MYDSDIIITPKEQLFIVRLRSSLRSTYITWRLGIRTDYLLPRETFYRHKRIFLKEYNIDIGKPCIAVPMHLSD